MQRKEPVYENGIAYWKCSKCGKWLPEDSYFHDKRTLNKLTVQCKTCHMQTSIRTRNVENKRKINREYMRRARNTNLDKFRVREVIQGAKQRIKNKIHIECRRILNCAVISGKVIKPSNCSECGRIRKITAHHDDYSKPLEVRWLCHECHGRQTVKDNGNE